MSATPNGLSRKMSTWKKVLIGVGGTLGILFLIGFIGALAEDSGEQPTIDVSAKQPENSGKGYMADCAGGGRTGVIDVGDIPECIEKGEFEENSLTRVKVRGSAPTQVLGKLFKIQGWDSQDRPIGGTLTVDHQETYDTLIRLDSSDWVNLSCYYHSLRYVEDYVEGGDVFYITVSLSDCIDLK